MDVVLILTAIFSILVFVSIINYFIRKIKFERVFGIEISVAIIGIAYFLFSVILFLWSINIFNFNRIDFLIVYSVILLAQTISLVNILYKYNHNKKVFYSLLVVIAIIPLASINILYLHYIVPLSLFITLLSFLTFSNSHQKTTALLITYSSFSLMAYVISLLWIKGIPFLVLVSTFLFLIFIHSFLVKLKSHHRPFLPPLKKKESPIIHFLKHFIFIIIITNFIFIGTVAVHELGHLAASGISSECSGNKIVYEFSSFPHTEAECRDISSKSFWILAGFLLPIIVSILLFFAGGETIKEIGLQIFGFNLMISYLDILGLGFSRTVSSFLAFLGAACIILSVILLARIRTSD